MKTRWMMIAGLVALCGMAQAETYVSDNFTGTTVSNWSFVTGAGEGASLTAQTGVDPVGSGWLRLNNNVTYQSSFVYNNTKIRTAGGLVFMFDFVMWGSDAVLADGLTLAIFNANATPGAGAYGGSMGYAQRTDTSANGLAGGVVGFGFDQYGNFSNPTEGRVGGPGKVTNSIAIRGSMGATRMDGYEYITGTGQLTDFSAANAVSRDAAVVRTARITITADEKISVEWKTSGETNFTTLIDQYQASLALPEEIMFGYTAGTGGKKSYHEIRNLSVNSVPEPATAMLLALGGGIAWLVRLKQRL